MKTLALFAICFLAAAAAPPEVTKVEPPNWWPGHTVNPVRLLIRGRNLTGAVVRPPSGWKSANVKTNAAGTYLFVDLVIPATAKPGAAAFKVTTPDGVAAVPFSLAAPLSRAARFQGFSPDDLIYLIMPDRFANGDPANDEPATSKGLLDRKRGRYYHGGDLQGIIDRLPYLKSLGITALWLNPWYDNNNRLNERERYDGQAITDYHGYGATDFYAVEEHFGDLAKLRELVDKAHAAGMKVIQDQVANHTGPYHPWVKDSPTPTWFNGTEQKHLSNAWQIWTLMDPYASPELRKATLDGWFIDILPDLNQDDPETARYIIQNTLWWIGATGIDGIRQDTLPYVPRRFWRDWMAAIKKEYPSFKVVGEMWDFDAALVSFFQTGRKQYDGIDSGIDTLFDFPLYDALRRTFVRGESMRTLARSFSRDPLYPNPGVLVTFFGSHDVPRWMGENGATAEGLKLAATLVLTARGTPMIYYGDEIALEGGNDPDNRRDFPGGWKEDARNAFEAGGRTPQQQSVFEHVRRLGEVRGKTVALRRGSMVQLHAEDATYAFARASGASFAIIAFNNSDRPATFEFGLGALKAADGTGLTDALGGAPLKVAGGRLRVALPAKSSAVYVP
ncbi:MAG: alpha-amylase family glycosyl hydrolase [Bryobacteraceae bacterium]|nr:alpha-amylase family glycosyl hydrolase [Bryobacteraceae bacterium]